MKKYLKVLRDNAACTVSNNVQCYLGKMWEPERKTKHWTDYVSRKSRVLFSLFSRYSKPKPQSCNCVQLKVRESSDKSVQCNPTGGGLDGFVAQS